MAGHTYSSMHISGGIVLNGNLRVTNIAAQALVASDIPLPLNAEENSHNSACTQLIKAGKTIGRLYNKDEQIPELVSDTARTVARGKASLDALSDAIRLAITTDYIASQHHVYISDMLKEASDALEELETMLECDLVQSSSSSDESKTVQNGAMLRYDEAVQLKAIFNEKLTRLHLCWQEFELPQRVMHHQHIRDLQNLFLSEQSVKQYSAVKSTVPALSDNTTSAIVVQDETDVFMNSYHGSCIKWCPCKCHRQSFGFAMGFSPILGLLFMCISGGNFAVRLHDCKQCRAQQPLRLRLSYFFPIWLSALALHIMITIRSNSLAPQLQRRWSHTCSATSEIFKLAELGNVDGIKRLFKSRMASVYDVAISTGRSALHYAVVYNQKEAAKFLLDQGADTSQEDKQRDSATNIAWERIYGKLADDEVSDAFRAMFTQDSDYFDNRNFTIFHKIVLGHNHSHLAQHLRLNETVSIDSKDANGRTPLSWAAARGDYNMTLQLLLAGADPNIQGRDGRTALHWAAQSADPATLATLVEHNADVHRLCFMRRTALHYAACNHNDKRYIVILLDKGIDIDARDCHDRTALGYATRKGHPETTRYLLERGADPALPDNWNYCPLIETARDTHHETLRCLMKSAEQRLRWDALTNQGAGVLHVIAEHGNHETMTIIGLERCKSLSWISEDKLGRTPLQIARERVNVCTKFKDAFEDMGEDTAGVALTS